jgi:predicted ester cyclase
MSTEANKATVERFYTACMNSGDVSAVDAIIAPDFIDLSYDLQGVNAVKQFIQDSRARFPTLNFTIEEMIAEGETVAVRWTGRGTHQNSRSATWTGMGFYHLRQGQIIYHWANVDQVALLKQLQLAPFSD